jgi:S-DNA-T family DNA segregation ATPase FtsK/SpoIIIE
MDQVRKNEIAAVILFAASFFLFLSLFTFSERDLSFYTSAPNLVPQNATGIIGSYIGGTLLFFVGKAAYVVPLLILVWGVARLMQSEPKKIFFKLFGAAVLVVAVGSSLSMTVDGNSTLAFQRGGIIGSVVSTFLLDYLGRVGATVFIVALTVLSLLIATEFLILPILVSLFKFLKGLPSRLPEMLPRGGSGTVSGGRAGSGKNSLSSAKKDIARKIDSVKKQVEERRRSDVSRKADKKKVEPVIESEPRIVKPSKPSRSSAKTASAPPSPAGNGASKGYELPGVDLLEEPDRESSGDREEDLKKRAALLEQTLAEFGVDAAVVKINRGPVITMYELEPAVGTKVNKITSLGDNISLAMRSANIRIVAPIPGKGTIGIEVPNEKSELVLLRELIESAEYAEKESPLKMALGKDISGKSIVTDLARMPHLLIAGSTGSGKTVCINCIISSLLYNSTPSEMKFVMVDPKRVELQVYNGLPHLVMPIITNPKKAAPALNWVITEMERRYEVFAEKGVRNIGAYKERRTEEDEKMPYIVVIVDELADLMMVAQQDVEAAIMRIAQLSRAAGIHMILATQRPSVNVITGVIKANLPARISFKVTSKVDSRTVLDTNGAEKLLGRGDMLLMEPGSPTLVRGQCSLVEDSEIRDLVDFIKEQREPQYYEKALESQESKKVGVDQEKDEMYSQALEIVLQTRQASVSMLQRKLRVGYTRAARMIDIMEDEGVVGAYNGSKPREILVDSLEEARGEA